MIIKSLLHIVHFEWPWPSYMLSDLELSKMNFVERPQSTSPCLREHFLSTTSIFDMIFVCLFVYSCTSNFSATASGGCHHNRSDRPANLCLAVKAFSSEGSFTCHTCCDMGSLDLYGLIRKTNTHIPQWDLNRPRKDLMITAPHRRHFW
jgi:hypothetical protein